jgi:hypothetical protein
MLISLAQNPDIGPKKTVFSDGQDVRGEGLISSGKAASSHYKKIILNKNNEL